MMLGDGSVPDDVESLMKIPGIGRYTAGAIASIAFEKRVPILDGNVMRVLSRLFLLKEDPRSTEGQKIFWKKQNFLQIF
jgi:A/G-specific adenine glycosylase